MQQDLCVQMRILLKDFRDVLYVAGLQLEVEMGYAACPVDYFLPNGNATMYVYTVHPWLSEHLRLGSLLKFR